MEKQEVIDIMQNIIINDKTPRYRYSGSRKYRENSRGEMPDNGRWLTPSEIAENYIRAIKGK